MPEEAIEPTEDQPLELTDEIDDSQEPDGDDADGEAVEGDDPDAGDEDAEETVVSFGDEDDGQDQEGDSSVIRRLRERLRESEKEKAELRKAVPAAPAIEVGEKPTLAGCEYDEEKYEDELDAWKERKAEAENATAKAEEQNRAANEEWQRDLEAYGEKKKALALPNFDEVEAHVISTLNQVQQAVVVKAAADPALFVAAIGRNEAKLAELAKIQDPIKLAAAIARMEGAIKVVKKRKGPAIDTPQRGSGSMPQADKKLEQLEKEARNSGDYSAVMAHKRALRDKGK